MTWLSRSLILCGHTVESRGSRLAGGSPTAASRRRAHLPSAAEAEVFLRVRLSAEGKERGGWGARGFVSPPAHSQSSGAWLRLTASHQAGSRFQTGAYEEEHRGLCQEIETQRGSGPFRRCRSSLVEKLAFEPKQSSFQCSRSERQRFLLPVCRVFC